MPQPIENNQLINHLRSVEAWAQGLLNESRKTRKLLEKADVSTPTNNSTDEHVIAAVTKFRQRLNKKASK